MTKRQKESNNAWQWYELLLISHRTLVTSAILTHLLNLQIFLFLKVMPVTNILTPLNCMKNKITQNEIVKIYKKHKINITIEEAEDISSFIDKMISAVKRRIKDDPDSLNFLLNDKWLAPERSPWRGSNSKVAFNAMKTYIDEFWRFTSNSWKIEKYVCNIQVINQLKRRGWTKKNSSTSSSDRWTGVLEPFFTRFKKFGGYRWEYI